MTEPAPIRPQRIIRANRETTGGLLMSVIRSLTTSRDSADRDRERLELEKGFQQCDLKLNDLINQHHADLYQVMATFSKILNNLSRSKERLIDTRDKLLNCQKLLHCKRDELKKLWLEMVENRAVHNLLERIEQINKLPEQVEAYAERKHYLHAAQCCVDGLRELGPGQQQQKMMTSDDSRWSSNHDSDNNRNDWINNANNQQHNQHSLSKIEALAQVRMELLSKKDMLFDRCLDELHRHLYIVSTERIRRGIFQQLQQAKNLDSENNQLTSSASSMIDTICWNQIWNQNNMKNDSKLDSSSDDWRLIGRPKAEQVTSDIENQFDPYPEEDSGQFITMLTKCIGLLNKIPAAVKIIRQKFDEEFVNLVIRTAQDIIMINESESSATTTSGYGQQNLRSIFENNPNQPIDNVFGNDSHRKQTANDHQLRELVVLTCTRLLGHHYDGFSHLKSIDRNEIIDVRTLEKQMPRTSIQLRQLFNLLLEQFYYVIQLHQSIVLLNFKRIENGLHLDNTFSDTATLDNMDSDINPPSSYNNRSTMFYTSMDIWCKIQLLLQQLLDYYLDVSQISGQSSSAGGPGLNYNLVSSLLPSAAMNMLFGVHHQATPSAIMAPVTTSVGGATGSFAENYSSFFVKRRPMMVAGAMNAMNVMMSSSSGKNATLLPGSNLPSSANQSSSTTAQGTNTSAVDNGPDSLVNNSNSTGNNADTGTTNDINNGGGQEVNVNASNQLQHISGTQTMFSHGGSWRYQQCNLFKFDHSSQAISWNTFLQQQQRQADNMLTSSGAGAGGDSDCLNNDEEQNPLGNDSVLKDTSFSSANKDNEIQLSSAVNHGNINSRLFDSLQSISGQSPDNLVLLYDVLIKHLQQCPISTDAKQQQHLNTLQSYLIGSTEKFTLHINSQLDAMLEQAQKSLEAGITIVLSCNDSLQVTIPSSSDIKFNDRISQQQSKHQCQNGHVLLQSAVLVDVAVQDLNILMMAMKDYCQNYLGYICNVLTAYKDTCNRLYDTVTSECPNSNNIAILNNLASPQSQLALSSLDLYNTTNSTMGQSGGNDDNRRAVLSAYWARNEDINRLLRSQPNWTQLKFANQRSSMLCSQQHQDGNQSSTPLKMKSSNTATTKYETRRMMINRQMSTSFSFDESPEVIRQRNASEVDILINLLSQEIQKSEMIWQEGQLTLLANMQQSFEWLSARCDYLVQMIQRQQQESNKEKQTDDDDDDDDTNGSPSSTDPYEVYIATLNQLSSDFEEIAQLCMLVLHLEIRVHCYYHLQALDAQFFTTPAPNSSTSANTVSDSQTASMSSAYANRSSSITSQRQSDLSDDIRIIPLLEDLERMYREISITKLSSAKMSYLFEGLGHFMTTIFMNAAMSVRRIKPNGIKRACRAIYDIQRPLSNITKSRELSLDYARQYFEMLMLTPDEIMAGIIERGRQFKEEEYINAITLLHQSSLTNYQLENQQSSTTTNSSINANNIINNGLDQHQSQQQLQHLLNRLNDILAEVTA